MRPNACLIAITTLTVVLASCESGRPPTSPEPEVSFSKAAPPSSSINVTSTIFDTNDSGGTVLTRSDDYNGSGFATYTTGSLTSHITSTGGWQLLLTGQSTRTVYLVLASQGITGVPDGYYSSNVELYARCFDQANTHVSILAMSAGQSNGNCTFGMDFSSGSTKYKLALGPDYDAASPTGRATVACNAASNGACTSWSIAVNAATANTFTLTNGQVVSAPAANLYTFARNGALTYRGSNHNSFRVNAAE